MNMDRELKKDCRNINSALSALGGNTAARSCTCWPTMDEAFASIPCKTLSSTLKKMESEGLLQRTEYPQIPPRVEYSLTEKGYSLLPVLLAMSRWGALHSL